MPLSRRSLIRLAGLGSATASLASRSSGASGAQSAGAESTMPHAAHYSGPVGRVSTAIFDPTAFARSWNFSGLAPDQRARHYREQPQANGTRLREYDIVATDPVDHRDRRLRSWLAPALRA